VEMGWRYLASELRLNTKTVEILSSFIRNVVRKDQFSLLDLRHLHFFNSTHPIIHSTPSVRFYCSRNMHDGGRDSEYDFIFNKMPELNTIYGKNFRLFNEPEEKFLMDKH
jgi:hypothetical protein